MPGALIQLVAQDVQDVYLTSDPQITFFKIVYRRHTNFCNESIIQNFTAAADFGEMVTCPIGKIGDLVGRVLLYVEIPSLPEFNDCFTKVAWVNNLGFALIEEVTFEIGGRLIDRQYGEWMYIWSQFTEKKCRGLDKMIGNVPCMYQFSNGKMGRGLYVPLDFWFCKYIGLSLPLVALSATDVAINITFRCLEECYRIGPTHSIEVMEDIVTFELGDYIEQTSGDHVIHGYFIDYDYLHKRLYYIKIVNHHAVKRAFDACDRIYNCLTHHFCTPKPGCLEMCETCCWLNRPRIVNAYLYVEYTYLDSYERGKFVMTHHEYLIEQIQYNQELGINHPNIKQNLTLNHPCKAHYWVVQLDGLRGPGTINDLFNYTTSCIRYPNGCPYGVNLVNSAKLLLDSCDRFDERSGSYFNSIEPFKYHSTAPVPGINMYSLCLHPEDHQPSGSCNMSKIDYICMTMHLNNVVNQHHTCRIRSYTVNYNILRVVFSLGGLVYV